MQLGQNDAAVLMENQRKKYFAAKLRDSLQKNQQYFFLYQWQGNAVLWGSLPRPSRPFTRLQGVNG